MKKVKIIVYLGLFIALDIVLTRFLSIQTPFLRIGFGFIPLALCGSILGPVAGGICGALSDVFGMLLFPNGPYFPGFTVSAFLSGIIYGFFLHKKITFKNIIFSVLIITIFIDIGLNTIWLSIMAGKAILSIIFPRIIKSAIMFPIQVMIIRYILKYLGKLNITNSK